MNTTNLILEQLYQQLGQLDPAKRLLILHPFVSQLHARVVLNLVETAPNAALVSLSPKEASYSAFLPFVVFELEQQTGQSLNISEMIPPSEASTRICEFLRQFETFQLVFENFDCSNDSDIDELLVNLMKGLPPKHRIVISGRAFHRDFLRVVPFELASVLPHIPKQLMVDYFQEAENLLRLEIHALGPSQATIGGRTVNNWDGVLPKSLFYFMVDRGMTTRTDIFENFWPALRRREATNVFHVTKRKVNEMIHHDLMKYASGYYRLADHFHLQYDVVLFQEAVQYAEIEEDSVQAALLYGHALGLYRGHFLSDLDHDWVLERREELQQVYSDALMGLGSIYWDNKDFVRAEGLLQRAFTNLPQRTDTLETALRFCLEQGKKDLGLHLYEFHVETLQKTNRANPNSDIMDLAEQLRAL